MTHPLDPLLRPASVAVLGASVRQGSVGNQTLRNLLDGQYGGDLFAINPRYEEVCGIACYASLAELPHRAEHVIFAVNDERIEAALDAAIAHGVKAVTLMSALMLDEDAEPPLKERIARKVRDAELLVCGGNAMGFYNFPDRIWACGFDTRAHKPTGNVALISHSGSGMSGILDVDERINFNLAVSTGQELTVGMEQYLDFALEQPETRVVGLFMETVRNPAAMRAAFAKANARGIPIVAIKVGRTELAAELAVSHSGAIAGTDAVFAALFDRYGVQRVDDMDELATTLIMFAQPHAVADGGLVSIHDSGGERQLTIDVADRAGVPFADLSPDTLATLQARLDPGLPAVNPLDAWSRGGVGAPAVVVDCLATMLADPAAALGAVIHDRAPHGRLYPEYVEYLRLAHTGSDKPMFLVANRQGTGADPAVIKTTEAGFPVIDGVRAFLTGVRCLFEHRNFHRRPTDEPPAVPSSAAHWRKLLAGGQQIDDMTGMALLADFGIPVNSVQFADNESAVVSAAQAFGYLVVLKTAAGAKHKTDVGGVVLAIGDEPALRNAYQGMSARLGAGVTVARMVDNDGVEMILGMIRDAQFGPLVMLGFGGVHAEVLRDVAFALPPLDALTARRLLSKLRLRPLLDGRRDGGAVAIDSYCEAAACFSVLAAELGEHVEAIDVNPLIVHRQGSVAIDVLVETTAVVVKTAIEAQQLKASTRRKATP